ncbi:DNA alkylation repair protein [Longimicrobium sp.]|uniref:DNA alkylation repair protein n=1 Tax=Longimicrobium sp. TaxID=2029185 RepID=UPI002E2ED744|nr:DNA alkylation repair protein [Longimicrobium sp.]HEX6040486.1 DNA alkylation repair protein [Longimicrobium sp.]
MTVSTDAQALLDRLERTRPNNTQTRALAKELGKSPALAAELWNSGRFSARMLSFLILDLKSVDVARMERMIADLESVEGKEQSQLLDWLIANVIMKKAALKDATAAWRDDPSTLRQRTFWSVQARSVRGGNHARNEELLAHIEQALATAPEKVQWNMNWCAAQIGIADERLRDRCLALGELGLYRDYPVPKGCTSPFLPLWIGSVVSKQATA